MCPRFGDPGCEAISRIPRVARYDSRRRAVQAPPGLVASSRRRTPSAGERTPDPQGVYQCLAMQAWSPQRFLLDGLTFETGSSEISQNALLDATAEELKESGAKIRIDGHADDQGIAAENQKLSLERAEAVKSYLVSKGVPESSITTRGLSETRPLAKNDTFEGRAENRRADLVVIER